MDSRTAAKWVPLQGMPADAGTWAIPGYEALAEEWSTCRAALKRDAAAGGFLESWLRERVRAFALETGQIEGLYTLRRGVAEQFVAEGFAAAAGAHTLEGIDGGVIRGLLNDQEAAYDMMLRDAVEGRPLSAYQVKSWHQLITRHQDTVAGIDPQGKRVQVPFETKGRWKERPNNPVRPDGVIHEYCPPEHVDAEMDRFFELYEGIAERDCPPNAKAAWLHHRFARAHPFQDGNGRVSRLLMAWPFLKDGLPPPIITTQDKPNYITALEVADQGDLRAFSNYLGALALGSLTAAELFGRQALAGNLNRPAGNGGRTVGSEYLPPVEGDSMPSAEGAKPTGKGGGPSP